MTTPEEREALIETVAGAWRPRDPLGGLRAHPAWHDLDASGREDAFALSQWMRAVEAALDPNGLSTTGHAVMARIVDMARGR